MSNFDFTGIKIEFHISRKSNANKIYIREAKNKIKPLLFCASMQYSNAQSRKKISCSNTTLESFGRGKSPTKINT